MTLDQALSLIALGLEISQGKLTDPQEIAHRVVALGLELVPVDQLSPFLTEAARRRADAIADAAERLKVG